MCFDLRSSLNGNGYKGNRVPKVSVVMCVYNGELYVHEAIDSILNQSFTDFEFIIVDDGSTDGTPGILKACAKQDRRIRLVRNTSNLGLIPSLNRGVQLANGEFIARQDADDISLPQRLALQVNFLDKHPEVGVLGTWMRNVEENGRGRVWKTPSSDPLIRWSLFFGTAIAHATVMIRRHLLDGDKTYRHEMAHAEDYDLWSRLSDRTKYVNLRECLYVRRKHQQMVSVKYSQEQQERGLVLMRRNIEKTVGAEVGDVLVTRLHEAQCGKILAGRSELAGVVDLVHALFASFTEKNRLNLREKTEIANDASCFLSRVALGHIKQYPRESIKILWNAACLYRGITFRPWVGAMLTTWKRVMNR